MENQEEKKQLKIFKVYYLFGIENPKTKKFPSDFVRTKAYDGKEALANAKKSGITSNRHLQRWLLPIFEKDVD